MISRPHRDVGVTLGQIEPLVRHHDVQHDLRIGAAKADQHVVEEMQQEDVAGGDPQFSRRPQILTGDPAFEADDVFAHALGELHHLLPAGRERITRATALEQA